MSKPAKISLRRGARPARGIYLRSSGSQIPEESKEDGRVTLTMLNEGEKLQIFCSGEWRTTDLPAEPGAHLFRQSSGRLATEWLWSGLLQSLNGHHRRPRTTL